jgi:hypothetical protein
MLFIIALGMVTEHLGVDWSSKGVVRPASDASCSAGPAQVIVEAVEAVHAIASQKPLEYLSVQQLLDCEQQQCAGGFLDFTYVNAKGLCTAAEYPRSFATCTDGHTCQGGLCNVSHCTPMQLTHGVKKVAQGNESHLAELLMQAPVALAVNADCAAFKSYTGGILDDPTCTSTHVDAPMLAVGFGVDPALGKEYWKLKNYWGTSWGEGGFIRLIRGKNMCGVAEYALQPEGGCLAQSVRCHLDRTDECCAGLACKMSAGTYKQPMCLPSKEDALWRI